jgi:hypothetical protein
VGTAQLESGRAHRGEHEHWPFDLADGRTDITANCVHWHPESEAVGGKDLHASALRVDFRTPARARVSVPAARRALTLLSADPND